MIIASLLKTRDKFIDQIQSILQLRKEKKIGKQFIEVIFDIAIVFRDNQRTKKRANNNKKYHNCYKPGHFDCDYFFPNRQPNWNTNQNRG